MNHYEVLGVAQDATPEEIKKAYRKLAREHHPDVRGSESDDEHFKRISHAYQVLSDPQKRRNYDATGNENGSSAGFSGFDGAGFGFQDIFDTFFGQGQQRSGPKSRARRGKDALIRVSIDLADAVFGANKKIEINTAVICPVCDGSCAQPGTHPVRCQVCAGAGSVSQQVRSFLGDVLTTTTCPNCQGFGDVIESPCHECHGQGRVRSKEEINVKIPAGVDTGMRIQLSGHGEVGPAGGPRADLVLEVKVEPDKVYTREGDNLLTELSIPMTAAALGTQVSVQTFDGDQPITIAAGTQSGEAIKLSGLGVTSLRSGRRGDIILTLHVQTPTKLNQQQQELLEKLATSRDETRVEAKLGTTNGGSMFAKLRERLGQH